MVFLDTFPEKAFGTLRHNSETGKCNGFMTENCTSNKLSSVLKLFTWDLPLVLADLPISGGFLEIQYKNYLKILNLALKYKVQLSLFTRIPTFITTGSKKLQLKQNRL
jgi:hypothetical protein